MTPEWIAVILPVAAGICGPLLYWWYKSPPYKNATSYPRIKFWTFVASYDIAPEKWRIEEDSLYREVDNRFVEVLFETRKDWRQYRRWQSKRQKAEQRRKQEEKNAEVREDIMKDYENFPKKEPEFAAPTPPVPPMPIMRPTTGTNVIDPKRDRATARHFVRFVYDLADDGQVVLPSMRPNDPKEAQRQEKIKEVFCDKGVNFD